MIAAHRAKEEARHQAGYVEIEAEQKREEEKRKAAKKKQGEAERLAEVRRRPKLVIVVALAATLLAMATSAGAAGGWYLMLPPAPENPALVVRPERHRGPTAHLSQWQQEEAFDRTVSCETRPHRVIRT